MKILPRGPLLHTLHRWSGLTAGVWLLLLGVTGLMLDHRDSWRWLWQSTVEAEWLPDHIRDKASAGGARIYQIAPDNDNARVAGGPQGLWWSGDAGHCWQATIFDDYQGEMPRVWMALFAWDVLWLASDDGLWVSADNGRSARRIALAGETVTALDAGSGKGDVVLVVDRSALFRVNLLPGEEATIAPLALPPMQDYYLPSQVNLSRFVHDLHFARGVFGATSDLILNDIAGVALSVLPICGFLFWYLPRYWRRLPKGEVSPQVKQQVMRWLYRFHGPLVGVVASIPLLYLAVTGILLDHTQELRAWLKGTQLTRSHLTPVYQMADWRGEIYGIAHIDKQIAGDANLHGDGLLVGTRQGLFLYHGEGVHWHRIPEVDGFVWSLRVLNGVIATGGMGAANYQWRDGSWNIVKNSGHMPTDVSVDRSGHWFWLSHKGVTITGASADTALLHPLPHRGGVPWYYVLEGLHNGEMFHSQWRWFNSFVAILATVLVITGVMRWWRAKWI